MRSSHKSCCEIYQYRINVDDFKISKSQKQTIRRFHNYLNYGSIHGAEEQKQADEAGGAAGNAEVNEGSKGASDGVIKEY